MTGKHHGFAPVIETKKAVPTEDQEDDTRQHGNDTIQ